MTAKPSFITLHHALILHDKTSRLFGYWLMTVNGKELDLLNTIFYKLVMSIVDALCFVFQILWPILNSNFFVALAGAFAGAVGATWYLSRKEKKKQIRTEIQNTNIAISLAFDITNTFVTFKKQLIEPMVRRYKNDNQRLDKFNEERKPNTKSAFEFEIDFRVLTMPASSVNPIQEQIVGNVQIIGRPLQCMLTLKQCIHSLEQCILNRNAFIAKCKDEQLEGLDLSSKYFGLVDGDYNVDKSYPDVMKHIEELTDDCIFFSKLLTDDLIKHGQKLKIRYGKNAPNVQVINLKDGVKERLFPPIENYKDWLSGFIEKK